MTFCPARAAWRPCSSALFFGRTGALKRLGRLDTARTTPGSGLGLSLAATLARMHGGDLLLEDNAPGLKVRVRLPLSA